jgi:hypothetical protein
VGEDVNMVGTAVSITGAAVGIGMVGKAVIVGMAVIVGKAVVVVGSGVGEQAGVFCTFFFQYFGCGAGW